jgi:Ca2+/Na+ antiporter
LAAARLPGASPQATQLLVPSMNEMFDITTKRRVAVQNHPPLAIFMLLGACCLVGSLLVGYTVAENKTRRWLHTLGFAFIMALAVYLIIDLEYPRLGLIRIDAADQVLIDLRASMR